MQAVLLAGGRGTRLRPLSDVLPKALFPIGGLPLAEILIRQLKNAGVNEVVICLGYLSNLIVAYFQDGKKFGLKIRYSYESIPLGTAGPLSNVVGLEDNFLVINADEFTNLDFAALFANHISNSTAMTIAVQNKPIKHSCGVLKIKNGLVLNYQEKPSFNFWVSMGIYVLSKRAVDLIPKQSIFNIPDLVLALLDREEKIASYVSKDLWFDIGTIEDLQKAQEIDLGLILK